MNVSFIYVHIHHTAVLFNVATTRTHMKYKDRISVDTCGNIISTIPMFGTFFLLLDFEDGIEIKNNTKNILNIEPNVIIV